MLFAWVTFSGTIQMFDERFWSPVVWISCCMTPCCMDQLPVCQQWAPGSVCSQCVDQLNRLGLWIHWYQPKSMECLSQCRWISCVSQCLDQLSVQMPAVCPSAWISCRLSAWISCLSQFLVPCLDQLSVPVPGTAVLSPWVSVSCHQVWSSLQCTVSHRLLPTVTRTVILGLEWMHVLSVGCPNPPPPPPLWQWPPDLVISVQIRPRALLKNL